MKAFLKKSHSTFNHFYCQTTCIHRFFRCLILVVVSFCGVQVAQAQVDNPYERMRRTAAGEPIIKAEMAKVTKTKADPDWKINKRPAVAFRPFEMVDQTGRKVPPTEMVTLKNGQKITAQEYFNQLNDMKPISL